MRVPGDDVDDGVLVVTSLRAVRGGTATALALFCAADVENRLRALSGFAGAAFLTSAGDDLLLGYVRWHSVADHDAARADERFVEHTTIVDAHSVIRHRGTTEPVFACALTRGDRVHVSLDASWARELRVVEVCAPSRGAFPAPYRLALVAERSA